MNPQSETRNPKDRRLGKTLQEIDGAEERLRKASCRKEIMESRDTIWRNIASHILNPAIWKSTIKKKPNEYQWWKTKFLHSAVHKGVCEKEKLENRDPASCILHPALHNLEIHTQEEAQWRSTMRNHWNKNLVQKYDSKKEIYRIDKRSEEIQTKDQLSGLYLVKNITDALENN